MKYFVSFDGGTRAEIAKLKSNFNFSISFELSLALHSYFPTTQPPNQPTG